MKSTLRVDFQGGDGTLPSGAPEGFFPVIRVEINESDDTRDRLLKTFFQELGGESSWLTVNFHNDHTDSKLPYNRRITLHPVRPEELSETRDIIDNRLGKATAPQFFSRFSIGDDVAFTTPKAKDYAFGEAKRQSPSTPDDEIEYIPEYFWGKIVAVKFTEAKVWYDVLDDYSGKVFEEIPSHDVKMFSEEVKTDLKANKCS